MPNQEDYLDNLLKELSIDARPKTLAELQKLPAEVLMDLAIEVEHFMDPSSKNYSNGSDSAAFFDNRDEKITLANRNIEDITANTIAHELGHAINYRLINATPESKEDMN